MAKSKNANGKCKGSGDNEEIFRMSKEMKSAAQRLRWDEVERLLENGESIYSQDSNGRTIRGVAATSYSAQYLRIRQKRMDGKQKNGKMQGLEKKYTAFMNTCTDYEHLMYDRNRN